MKNKDLILKLQALDPEAEVITSSDNFELNGANVPVGSVIPYTTGNVSNRGFRDAFDGGSYSKDVYSIIGGNLSVIFIA